VIVETIIVAGVAGGLFGFLAGWLFTTAASVAPLERMLTDQRRIAKRWQACSERWEQTAGRWRNRARLAEEIHRLERQALGVGPPERWRDQPERRLQLVDGGES